MNIPSNKLLQKWAVLLIASGIIFTFSDAAHAQSYASCGTYVAGSSGIPPLVADLMQKRGDATAHACMDFEGKIGLYSPATTVREGAMHVCSYEIHSVVFPVSADHEPYVQMVVPQQSGCPPPSDRSYVWVQDVSQGLFAALVAFSDRVCLNPKGDFKKFVSPTAPDALFIDDQLESLCASLPASRPSLRDWLRGVHFDTHVSSKDTRDYLLYRMEFGDFGAKGHMLELWVDLDQGKIKVNAIQLYTDVED